MLVKSSFVDKRALAHGAFQHRFLEEYNLQVSVIVDARCPSLLHYRSCVGRTHQMSVEVRLRMKGTITVFAIEVTCLKKVSIKLYVTVGIE